MDSQESTLEQGQMMDENKVEELVNTEEKAQPAQPAAEEIPVEDSQVENAAAEKQEPVAAEPEPAAAETESEPAGELPKMEEEISAESGISEEKKEEENITAEEEEPSEEEKTDEKDASKKVYKTRQEVLERIQEIAHSDEAPKKEEIDLLKLVFYKLQNAAREAQMKEYLDNGGDPEKYQVLTDDTESKFKAEMIIIKEKRAKLLKEQEVEKEENLKRKLEIIENVKNMATSPEEANKSYPEFKKLQQEWKEIGNVPAERANELWRTYQLYVEQFYDLLKLNSEAREYDFKKNLEAKTKLCETAERLAEESDIISASRQLQKLHQQYREIGPVSRDLREEVWARFKAASTIINKRHQQHFEGKRVQEEENLVKKTALCEKVEAVAKEENKSISDWEKHTREIVAIQAEWKKIGYAPQKMNVKIFERFRSVCDDFFSRKSQFFKDMKADYAENVAKKRSLIERAKALQDSTDWNSTGEKLIALQKEWKATGRVAKKLADQLWEEFVGACNKFFEARNAATGNEANNQKENLQKKRDIIAKLKAAAEEAGEGLQEKVQTLVEEYNAVGHVPYKEKDKLFKEYHDVLDKLYKDLNITINRRRLDNFKSSLKGMVKRGEDALDNERVRLLRRYDSLKQEIQTYENNIGFLSVSSKKGSSLIDEMNRKVEKLKNDFNLVRDKIKAIDAANAAGDVEQPQKEQPAVDAEPEGEQPAAGE